MEIALWFRPDKFANTGQKLNKGIGEKHFVIHVLDEKGTGKKIIRAIDLDQAFFKRLNENAFSTVYPTIRGRREIYIEIPHNDSSVISIGEFIELLQNLK
ncbi:MAG TPA: hypothetical protein VHA56_02600 [Mucilaginibacter sp.]|nr:hypothetical protein [Mucilaginibacter sp.]